MDGLVTGEFRGTIEGVATFRPGGNSGKTIVCQEDRRIVMVDSLGDIEGPVKRVYQLRDDELLIAGGQNTSPSLIRLAFGTYGRAIGASSQGKTQHEIGMMWRPSTPNEFRVEHRVTAPSHHFLATTNFRRLAPEAE